MKAHEVAGANAIGRIKPIHELVGMNTGSTLEGKIEFWQSFFDKIVCDTSNPEIAEIRNYAAEDMMGLCSIVGAHCCFSGFGLRTGLDGSYNQIENEDFIDCDEGQCLGLGVMDFRRQRSKLKEGVKQWRVAWYFDNIPISPEPTVENAAYYFLMPEMPFTGATALDHQTAKITIIDEVCTDRLGIAQMLET